MALAMVGVALTVSVVGCSSNAATTGGADASAQGATTSTAAKNGSKAAVAAVIPALADQPVASVPSNIKDVTLEIYEVRRAAGAATVAFAVNNKGTSELSMNYQLASGVTANVGAVSLVDVGNLKRYLTLKDDEGGCVCSSTQSVGVPAGSRSYFYATFTAPPAEVISIVVETPMGSVPGVPITDA